MKIKLFRDHAGAFTSREHSVIAEVYDTESADPEQIQTLIDALNPQTMQYLGYCETSEELRKAVVEVISHDPDLLDYLIPHLTLTDKTISPAELQEDPGVIGQTVLLEQHVLQFRQPGPYILYRPAREQPPTAVPAWRPLLIETENQWLQNVAVEDRKFVPSHWVEYVTEETR